MSEQTFDPWLKARELTSQRNELHEVADLYSKMQRMATQQANVLRQKRGTKADTLNQLTAFASWCGMKGEPLWERIATLDKQIETELENSNYGN